MVHSEGWDLLGLYVVPLGTGGQDGTWNTFHGGPTSHSGFVMRSKIAIYLLF